MCRLQVSAARSNELKAPEIMHKITISHSGIAVLVQCASYRFQSGLHLYRCFHFQLSVWFLPDSCCAVTPALGRFLWQEWQLQSLRVCPRDKRPHSQRGGGAAPQSGLINDRCCDPTGYKATFLFSVVITGFRRKSGDKTSSCLTGLPNWGRSDQQHPAPTTCQLWADDLQGGLHSRQTVTISINSARFIFIFNLHSKRQSEITTDIASPSPDDAPHVVF